MQETLSRAREVYTDEGIEGVCRAASRYASRQFYSVTNGTSHNRKGVDVFREDWDNLLILDACRYDYFKRFNTIEGELQSRISKGSHSEEFVRANFRNRCAYDTVYLSDNPWYSKLKDELDAELYDFSVCERDAFDGIVSYPSTVTDNAIDYSQTYPNKRLIVHYLQPHAPYFTTTGEERYRWPSENHSDCDPEELKRAYADNVKLVLAEVERLLDTLVGKTVITADHGELLGERLFPFPLRQYQHPKGIYTEDLVKVPWLIIDDGERKTITSGGYTDGVATREETGDVEKRLEALGYR